MKHETVEELIKLSKIFKEGYTVEIKEGNLNQYTNYSKPFIVSYETLIEITDNSINYKHINDLTDNCIIGGWLDSDTNTYYIELNKAFKDRNKALVFAIKHSQKAIYNMRTGKIITKYKGIDL